MTVIAVVHNEALRLPYFLSYYEAMGVERFIFLDHQSDDETGQIIDDHGASVRIPVAGNFVYKTAWLSAVLDACCMDRWCLVLDADEFLVYPAMDSVPLRNLLRYFDEAGYDALSCRLLDMYPANSVSEAGYRCGQDPLEVAPYFNCNVPTRSKAFGVSPDLRKTPLFRFGQGRCLRKGQHYVSGARPAAIRGCLLHFKFLQDFKVKNLSNALLRLVDRQYWRELNAYHSRLRQEPAFILWSPDSIRYVGLDQLIELGLMVSTPEYQAFVAVQGSR